MKSGRKCIGFIDNNPDIVGGNILGKRVHSPNDFFELIRRRENYHVIIATDIPQYLYDMYKQAFKEIMNPYKVHVFFNGEFDSYEIDYAKLRECVF